MNCLSHARSYISLGLLKRSSYVSSQIPWNQCFYTPSKSCLKPAGVTAFGLSKVQFYSSRTKAGKSKMSSTVVSVTDKEKDAFFVVRKGDVIGIYKDLSDCQAQVGSSVNTFLALLSLVYIYIYIYILSLGWDYDRNGCFLTAGIWSSC